MTHARLSPSLASVLAAGVLTAGCVNTEPTAVPDLPAPITPAVTYKGFSWVSATPESQGMCGATRQLGCTTTLLDVWNGISDSQYNTKRLIVIRNDKILFDRGGTSPYHAYSASKGLLGAPTLVYAMSRCGVGLSDPASRWLAHDDGARWGTVYPWTDITIEQLSSHTSGICDYSNPSAVCRGDPRWQNAYDRADGGGTKFLYPADAFTIARTRAEQNREPALAPGSVFEYTDIGHALMNYAVQRACGQKLTDIFDLYIKQAGMGSPRGTALLYTDDAQQFNQASGVAKWIGLDGAAVLRLAGRKGIWDNRNVEPVRYWSLLTRITDNIPAAAAAGFGVVYGNNATDMWTRSAGHRRLSREMFGHGGNYSNVWLNDPLTGTIIVRQGENNATGASYLTKNGCAPGWTGTAPNCVAGKNWSNNWDVPNTTVGYSSVGPRTKLLEPLQEAFFFPPPFCRMTSAAGATVDNTTDVYDTPPGAETIGLTAEIQINPREGAGSSVADKVEFYKEGAGTAPQYIGTGTLVAGTDPAEYRLAYRADSHGQVNEVRTYFANCVASSVQDTSKKVPSYSRPVRVRRM